MSLKEEEVDSIAFENKDHRKKRALSCSYSSKHSRSCLDNVDVRDTKSHNKWANYKLLATDFGGIGNSDDVRRAKEGFVGGELCMKARHLKPTTKQQFHNSIVRVEWPNYFDDTSEALHLVSKQHF
jgi:hypothetical protein